MTARIALVAALSAAPAAAQDGGLLFGQTEKVRAAAEDGALMSFPQIVSKLDARTAAFVIEVELERDLVGDRETWVYEIEALTDDLEDVEIEVNGRTGEVMEIDD